ncbi:MAG: Membrane protein [Labilithrix sp.]|nr:Membrane protein [Labilithrix sp.]
MTRIVHVALALLVAALVAFAARDAHAHASRTAYLDVTELGEGEAVASLRADPHAPIALSSPDCSVDAIPGAARSQSITLLRLRCARGLAGATLEASGMIGSDVVIARVAFQRGDAHGAVLTARSPRLVVPTSGSGPSIFTHYVRLGIEHVLSGIDHILFLLALVWQTHAAARGALRAWAATLARAATGFTVAHTATLTATTLGWIHVPPDLAETMIAVSLVLVALDVGRATTSSRLGIVMPFGLVHGLGFAGALAEARLPEHAVAIGLLGFNVGVELGQLCFLALAVAAIAVFLRSRPVQARAAVFAAYAIGATGAYLVIARSTFFR